MALPKRSLQIRNDLGWFVVKSAPGDAERLPALGDEDPAALAVRLEALRGPVDGAAVELHRHLLALPEGVEVVPRQSDRLGGSDPSRAAPTYASSATWRSTSSSGLRKKESLTPRVLHSTNPSLSREAQQKRPQPAVAVSGFDPFK